MTIKRGIFWMHLVLGVVCGLVIALMAATGAVIAFQNEIIAFAQRDVARVEPASAPRLPLDTLLKSVREKNPDTQPSAITVYDDPGAAVQFMMGREKPALYANPYTGEIREQDSAGLRKFMAFSLQLHRWLALGGDGRAAGQAITGACSLAFLLLSFSGLYLWWPRRWSWRTLKPTTGFIKGAKGKARDWNWHNVFGFWSLPLLILLSSTGVLMSYRWASNLLYLVAGETPPPRRERGGEGPPGDGGPQGERRPSGEPGTAPARAAGEGEVRPESDSGGERRTVPAAEGERRAPGQGGEGGPGGRGEAAAPRILPPSPDAKALSYEALLGFAQKEVPAWKTISFRLGQAGGGMQRGAGAGGRRAEGAGAAAEPGEPRRPESEYGEVVRSGEGAPVEGASGEAPRRRRRSEGGETGAGAGQREGGRRGAGAGARAGIPAASVTVRRDDSIPLTAQVTLTLNPYTGELIRREGFSDRSLGNKLRGSVRPVHTGEGFGIPGQILAFAGALATLVLVYTGLALSWRRFFPARKKRHHQHRDEPHAQPILKTGHES